jgi:ubiquinone/menaquinone biosynthesis C-methylase UbiE
MVDDLRTIAASFDQRAARYSTVEWHRDYARRFVELASLEPGQRVLDAGAGTGFATIEIARRVGAAGTVVAVDASAGMLAHLQIVIDAEHLSHIELLQGDATSLPELPGSTFDAVLCSSALLYMSADSALREWHRLLKPRGSVGFSTMCADSPPPGRLFRECARAFGLALEDPSAALGSDERCREAFHSAGFAEVRVIPGSIQLSPSDLSVAWESNFRSTGHTSVRGLSQEKLDLLRERYEAALQSALAVDATALTTGGALFAFARKPLTDRSSDSGRHSDDSGVSYT